MYNHNYEIIKVYCVNLLILYSFILQLKNFVNQDETSRCAKVKDRKFLEGLAKDKRYLEEIIDQLSSSKVGQNPRNVTTRSMVSEVIITQTYYIISCMY